MVYLNITISILTLNNSGLKLQLKDKVVRLDKIRRQSYSNY